MPEHPDPSKRLDRLLSAAMIAHEAIFEMRRELIARDKADAAQASLLEESAQIVTAKLPALTARARQLSREWSEQSLLHPEGADTVATELEAEVERVEPEIRLLLDRQRKIAGELRSMLGP
jgi:hypothetical protein